MSVSQRIQWSVRAGGEDKNEFLHQQVELLLQQLSDARQEITRVETALRSALEQAEVRQQHAYQQLTGHLEAREQRAARVDAHCIWPIAFGILLTGLPGELAAVAVLGWLSIAASIAVTFWAGRAVMADQAVRVGS